MRGSQHGKRGVNSATLDQGIYLKACSLLGDHCGRRSLLESLEMVYLLSCNRDISRNRSARVELKI